MRTVIVAVLPVIPERIRIVSGGGTATKLRMSGSNSSVDDVYRDASAIVGGAVIAVITVETRPLVYAIEPPRCVRLRCGNRHLLILLDVSHTRVRADRQRLALGHPRREAVDGVLELVPDFAPVECNQFLSHL